MTPELRMHFKNSAAWKDARLMQNSIFQEVHHQGQDYVGMLLEDDHPTLRDLRACDAQLREALQQFCPDFDHEEMNVLIFPQTFVS